MSNDNLLNNPPIFESAKGQFGSNSGFDDHSFLIKAFQY